MQTYKKPSFRFNLSRISAVADDENESTSRMAIIFIIVMMKNLVGLRMEGPEQFFMEE